MQWFHVLTERIGFRLLNLVCKINFSLDFEEKKINKTQTRTHTQTLKKNPFLGNGRINAIAVHGNGNVWVGGDMSNFGNSSPPPFTANIAVLSGNNWISRGNRKKKENF